MLRALIIVSVGLASASPPPQRGEHPRRLFDDAKKAASGVASAAKGAASAAGSAASALHGAAAGAPSPGTKLPAIEGALAKAMVRALPAGIFGRGLILGSPIADVMYLLRTAAGRSQAERIQEDMSMPNEMAESNPDAGNLTESLARQAPGVMVTTPIPNPYDPRNPYGAGQPNQKLGDSSSPAEIMAAQFLLYFDSWLGMCALVMIFGMCCYKRARVDPKGPADPLRTFQYGHFGCLEDFNTCCCAMVCPALRWADTVSIARLLQFWPAVIVYMLAVLLDYFWIGGLAVVLLWYRQQLREMLGLPHSSCRTCCADFFFALCCPCCLIAQEARVMNEAYRVGHPAIVTIGGASSAYETRGYGAPTSYRQGPGPYAPQGYSYSAPGPVQQQGYSQGYPSQGYSPAAYQPGGFAPQGYSSSYSSRHYSNAP